MSAAVLATCSFAAPGSRKPFASAWARVGVRLPIVASNAFRMSSTLVIVAPPLVRVRDQHTDGGYRAVPSVVLDESIQPLYDVRRRVVAVEVGLGRVAREHEYGIPSQSPGALYIRIESVSDHERPATTGAVQGRSEDR